MLSRFSNAALTRSEMKNVRGGAYYRCWCNGAMSTKFESTSQSTATTYCSNPKNTGGREPCTASKA
ncbi:TIGR04149 family rSAM-modified RiPP [Tellurirhabdus rosea]|uniref:TIGR04149 family rSAM-modified RiPP n=1 Tax=Tellurirhabdus rosea TaxID=2674997 RepID=UPI00389AEB6F